VLLAASFAGGAISPAAFFPAYLFSFAFWTGLSLGSMAILMVHYQVGGSWGFVTRRILEAGMLTLPLMAVLFVPILFGLHTLYPWAGPDPGFARLRPYLNVPFFVARTAGYFAVWMLWAWLLARGSKALDRRGDIASAVWLRRLSGPGLLVYALTMFFASVDWVMSTEPGWSSTVFGMIVLAGQALSAFAMATGVLVLLAESPPFSAVATPSRFNDLGNLILTSVMLWAYVAFSQYLIIWAENLPREITWYVQRTAPGWKGVAFLLLLLHFAVPFVLLLFRAVKRNPAWLGSLAGTLLVLRLVDDYWRVIPSFRPAGFSIHWTDVTTPLGIGGLWVALFAEILRRRPPLPLADPGFEPVLAEVRAHA
jgi:hypothetical protein